MMASAPDVLFGHLGFSPSLDATRWSDGRTEIVDDRGWSGVFRLRPANEGRDLWTTTTEEMFEMITQAREMFSPATD